MKNWRIEPKISCVAQFVRCYRLIEKEANDTTHNYPNLNSGPSAELPLNNRIIIVKIVMMNYQAQTVIGSFQTVKPCT